MIFLINIAIDGPSGAGKSTIARKAAAYLGYIYIDTGAMYRAVGLFMTRLGINIKSEKEKVIKNLPDVSIDLKYQNNEQRIFLNGEDVSDLIRTPEISMAASDAGTVIKIREKMTELQRQLAKNNNCIMDGRDIGSYVLPDADVKIYLTADVKIRAERRFKELCQKGEAVKYEDVLSDMIQRDKNDSTRKFMPLKKADDAVLIDTSDLSLDESVKAVINCIGDRVK